MEVAGGEDVALWLPAELWAMVCGYLGTGDLTRLSATCWDLRAQVLAKVRHHTSSPLGLVTRRGSMRQVLKFTSTWPSLVSLDLSAWDTFTDSLMTHLPETLESLSVSHTSITNRGLARLPLGLTRLDISATEVTGAGLRSLSGLTCLRELKLSTIGGLSATHLRWIPSSVEALDLSNCSGPLTESQLGVARDGSLQRVRWPPALRELNLAGALLSFGQFYGMPATLERLDISNCTLMLYSVDLDACLPRLHTLCAANAAVHWRSSPSQSWSLPSNLRSLSFAHTHHLAEPSDWRVSFLPASITSLDLSHTRLAQSQQAWETSRCCYSWFESLPKRLPHLRSLDLTLAFGASIEPRCLQAMQENGVSVSWRRVSYTLPDKRPAEPAQDPGVPREEDAQWRAFIKLCAEERARIKWCELANDDGDGDHNGQAEEEEEKALLRGDEGDEEDDEGDDAQGSLLFMGF